MRTLDYQLIILVANSMNESDEADAIIEEEEDSRSVEENINNVSSYSFIYSGNGPFSVHLKMLNLFQKCLSVGFGQLVL